MLQPETELAINRLSDAFRTSFDWVVERHRQGDVHDLAEAWADLTATGLQDVRLLAAPTVDPGEPLIPFIHTHRLKTDTFVVARSGMRGGPNLDLLVQLWFDTEDVVGGFGVPLLVRRVPCAGPMPEPLWAELHEASHRLTQATPSGRLVLFAEGGDFDWGETSIIRRHPIIVMGASLLAGFRRPPHPVSGRTIHHFAHDLASGWVGDPALSGREPSPILDEVMSNFLVGHVLRIRIERDDR